MSIRISLLAAASLSLCNLASAHVGLPAGGATAGSNYDAAFTVGHACEGAQSTTALTVQLPAGFRFAEAIPRDGWTLSTPKAGSDGGEVRWAANSAANALTGHDRVSFIVRGTLPKQTGVLYFPVKQSCDVGQAEWVQIPAPGDSSKLKMPAAKLEVLAADIAPVDIKGAWVRATIAGQSGTGAFMTLQAPMGARLIGVSTPAAGVSEVHEMKMEDNVMRMRQVKGLDLAPRQPVSLTPGGFHIMLMDLKQPMAEGQHIDLDLLFETATGTKLHRTVSAEVKKAAPGGAAAPSGHQH